MRAREPDTEGYVDRDGFKLHWEVFGDGEPTLLLLPTWTVVHARFWKAQVPYLARHFRIVTYDGPGNGRSDRPEVPAPYRYEVQGRSVLAVLDATGTDRAVLVSLSEGGQWALWAAAHHPGRVLGVVIARERAPWPDEAILRGRCARVRRPVLVIHGDEDEISPPRCGAALARATGGALVVLEGAGHIPNARDPVRVNLLVREFAESLSGRA
jgi:pimeloyl-ACP methyl ester carboxylesterase